MNSTSINLYISKIEAENVKLKNLLEDKIAVIERLDAEIFKLHQKLEILTDDDCESEVGSCDEPVYEFDSDSDSDTESESEPPQKVRRVLSPSYDDDDSDSESVNEDLYYALFRVAEDEENLYKKAAFKKAAETIYNLPFKVKGGSELSSGPKKVVGIGKTIALMIDEYITTGKITRGESINHKLAAAFDKLATLTIKDEFKSLAYSNAAEIVRNFKGLITNGKKLSEGPQKVKGIGKGIGRMIDEFMSTGQISKIQELAK